MNELWAFVLIAVIVLCGGVKISIGDIHIGNKHRNHENDEN